MAGEAGRPGPKYRQIADDIRARIASGEFTDGRLPSKDQLHSRYSAAINTIERAIGELRKEGRVETVHGSGTFVRTPPAPEPAPDYADLERRLTAAEVDIMELYARLGYEKHQHGNGKARHEQAG